MDGQMDMKKPGNRRRILQAVFGIGLVAALLVGMIGTILNPARAAGPPADLVEPEAGNWTTWVLENGSQLRPPAPPGRQATRAEIKVLKQLAAQRDEAVLERIAYWNTGAPVYRWNEIAIEETIAANINSPVSGRMLALIHAAVYDATIAAWDAKYTYERRRPSQVDRNLQTVISNPPSPSYPSEHAVAAGAASEVLAYLFPDRADYFRAKAQEAGEAFLYAGVQFPSDVDTGLELGRQVAALVIERAKNDNSDAQWDGTRPTGPGYWPGETPALPMAGTWQTWALESGSEFRPKPPFAYDSPEREAEMEELRNFERTPKSNTQALFWEYGAGGMRVHVFWNEQLSRKLLEYGLDDNPPRAARAFALMNIAFYDSTVACWDAKYAYWTLRPVHYDPDFQPLFNTPGHPSYPSAHSCLSGAAAGVIGYLFPSEAERYQPLLETIGEARIWGGLHYRSDVTAGQNLGQNVAEKVIEHARNDGSE